MLLPPSQTHARTHNRPAVRLKDLARLSQCKELLDLQDDSNNENVSNVQKILRRKVARIQPLKEPTQHLNFLSAVHNAKSNAPRRVDFYNDYFCSDSRPDPYFKRENTLIEIQQLPYLITPIRSLKIQELVPKFPHTYSDFANREYNFIKKAIREYGLTFEEASALFAFLSRDSSEHLPLLAKDQDAYRRFLEKNRDIYTTLDSEKKIDDTAKLLIARQNLFFRNLECALSKLQKTHSTTQPVYRGLHPAYASNKAFFERDRFSKFSDKLLEPGSIIDTPLLFFTPILEIAQKYTAATSRILELKDSPTLDLSKDSAEYFGDHPQTLALPGKMQIVDIRYYPKLDILEKLDISTAEEVLTALREAQQAGSMKNFNWKQYGRLIGIFYTAQIVEDGEISKIPAGSVHIYTEPGAFEEEYLELLFWHKIREKNRA